MSATRVVVLGGRGNFGARICRALSSDSSILVLVAGPWGWQELTRLRFAQIGARWAAACDVPDLELVPLPIERWATPLDRIASLFDGFGGKHGGMLISLVGTSSAGSRKRLEWHLTAPARDGPEIPSMAAILLARKIAQGRIVERGAHACARFLSLAEFEPEFTRWGIKTAVEEAAA